jgi:putative transposase
LKLTIKVAKRTIQKYMQAARSKPPSGQSGSTFLKTHGQDIWACDFVPVVTLFFRTLHAFVIVHHESRRVVHVGVTDHPTDEWITQQVRDATPFEEKPKFLICDNDKRYGHMFERVVQASSIEVIHTPYEAPRANGYDSCCTSSDGFGMNWSGRGRLLSFWPCCLVGTASPIGNSYRHSALSL